MTVTNVTDVVEAAQAGEAAAREELVAACLPLVYNIAGRALNGHADVDDVVQETMIRMVGGLAGLRDPARFRSWLVAITMNQIRHHWRTERQDAPVTGLQDAFDVHDPEADFVGLTIIRLGLEGQRKQAAEATRWLDDGERAVLSLWWLEATGELTRAEVAAALELSPQHTAVRVQRTKIQLETARAVVRALTTTPRCRELAGVLGLWDGVPSPLWRKRIARHARGCGDCGGHWSALVPAEGLLAGLGLVPVGAALAGRWAEAALRAVPTACGTALPAAPEHVGLPPATDRAALPRGEGAGGSSRAIARPVVAAATLAIVAGGVLSGCDYFAAAPEGAGPQQRSAPGTNVSVSARPLATAHSSPSGTAPPERTAPAAGRSAATGRPALGESARATPATSPAAPASTAPAPAVPPRAPATGAPSEQAPHDPLAQQVTRLVNTERAKAGCGPVRHSVELVAAAGQRSGHAAAHGRLTYSGRTDPGERGGADDAAGAGRAAATGHRWSFSGVSGGTGRPSAAAVVTVWMNDSGHRKALLDCSLTEFGVNVDLASGVPRWTQAFAAR
ncbi:sigma-70 family RNA polymerase sigma factor [Streptomyces sp. NPDC026206]|uniref:sigma-70 family RNA polymerase sigma factor n=1 Tax=Streptomyces sp. NPDC026206 TaxID=3157089 RepID=UPI0033E42AA0